MKTIHTNAVHTKWLNAEDMHEASKKWLSELEFCKEEQIFFEDLITSFTLQILDNENFEAGRSLIGELSETVKQTQILINAVKAHESGLSIMVDGVDQIKEETDYKKEHRNLMELINEFQKRYHTVKTKLFSVIKTIMKEGKQKRLINKK